MNVEIGETLSNIEIMQNLSRTFGWVNLAVGSLLLIFAIGLLEIRNGIKFGNFI